LNFYKEKKKNENYIFVIIKCINIEVDNLLWILPDQADCFLV
jgi:hypothetical protein